jgi:ribosomal silencing factor RsfS
MDVGFVCGKDGGSEGRRRRRWVCLPIIQIMVHIALFCTETVKLKQIKDLYPLNIFNIPPSLPN